MVSTQNLSPQDLIKIAEKMIEKGHGRCHTTVAVLVTTTKYDDEEGEDRIVSQAIVPCMEVDV